uniref:Uncharacterized protein n=1 Tax=Opuntia streptacantha TaxID=393608 RepID=A0A7C9EPZ0_OPUST
MSAESLINLLLPMSSFCNARVVTSSNRSSAVYTATLSLSSHWPTAWLPNWLSSASKSMPLMLLIVFVSCSSWDLNPHADAISASALDPKFINSDPAMLNNRASAILFLLPQVCWKSNWWEWNTIAGNFNCSFGCVDN